MSEHINNVSKRKEALMMVIKRLHEGETVENLQKEFGEIIQGATAAEIAEAERAMISEGVTVNEIQRLCDLHVAVFRESLDQEPAPKSLPGHPVFTFRMENEVTTRLLETMHSTLDEWQAGQESALESLQLQAKNLASIEKHYSRKENLLFPYLEKKNFEGPATVMWGVDNEIHAQIKDFKQALHNETPDFVTAQEKFDIMANNIQEMIYKEERILFPAALERLSEQEWAEIRQQEDDIGYFNITPKNGWQPSIDEETVSVEAEKPAFAQELISLATGALTRDQVDLMLTHLPVDVTFVDENDHVRYFTQGKERIFDRSAAIIGREVTKCHPPQSVHKVEEILEDFRAGKRDVAEFWIQAGGQFIHIRYFALHDAEGTYQGCIEVSQNVTHIRALEGEKRLLD